MGDPHETREVLVDVALTERELEILQRMAEGLSNRQIGERLYVAIGTVGKHSGNIFAKLNAANRAEAVLRGRELDLLE
jgi:LuxR family maltose regulon positive regulatory protein